MKNEEEEDVLEEGKLTEQEAKAWTTEYFNTEVKESTVKLAEKWTKEHLQGNGKYLICFYLNIRLQLLDYFEIYFVEDEINSGFWNKLQEEMKKVTESEVDPAHPWLNEFNNYDIPQKVFFFIYIYT